MFTKEEIKLAPQTIKALEKLGKANKISQQGMVEQAKESIRKKERGKYKLVYKKDTKTIIAEPRGWKWQPKVGEWCIEIKTDKGIHLISDLDDFERKFLVNNTIPILHWEKIEEILEGLGWTKFYFGIWGSKGVRATSRKLGSRLECSGVGKKRQTAVMEAIIQFSKENK